MHWLVFPGPFFSTAVPQSVPLVHGHLALRIPGNHVELRIDKHLPHPVEQLH